jgi:hypothetical protein
VQKIPAFGNTQNVISNAIAEAEPKATKNCEENWHCLLHRISVSGVESRIDHFFGQEIL